MLLYPQFHRLLIPVASIILFPQRLKILKYFKLAMLLLIILYSLFGQKPIIKSSKHALNKEENMPKTLSVHNAIICGSGRFEVIICSICWFNTIERHLKNWNRLFLRSKSFQKYEFYKIFPQ